MKQILYKIFVSALMLTATTVLTGCSDKAQLLPLNAGSTILAFGDSLTYGTGTSRDKAYPAVLEKLIHHKVINAGIPGEISATGLARLPALLRKHQPELIIICHGGNDILGKLNLAKTRDNIQSMITLARTHNTQVMLIGVPKFGLLLKTSPFYQALADSNHIPIASDILSNILSKNTLKSDYIHPNTLGYQMLAENIALTLKYSGALANE